ncbi:MAG: hypothetical protein JW833_06035, partial [Prolixibacteraceae bacterium]|nr:hypothetical protein [Prolixibacteraceae bacterium]
MTLIFDLFRILISPLEELMAVFFKTHIEEAKSLKQKLTESKKKLEAIENRFVTGEIDRSLFGKFRPKYEKECFDIEQEPGKTGGYKSNLAKVVNFAAKIYINPLILWE